MLSSFTSKNYIFSFLTRIVSILVLTRRNNSVGINKLITSLLNSITSFWVNLASLDNSLGKNVTSTISISSTTNMSLFKLNVLVDFIILLLKDGNLGSQFVTLNDVSIDVHSGSLPVSNLLASKLNFTFHC